MKNDTIKGAIISAGEGSRMGQLGKKMPKCLLPVCNKPILQYQIEEFINAGIKEAYIVVNYKKQMVKKFLAKNKNFGIDIILIEQKKRLGIANAIGTLENYLNAPFILYLGDIFMLHGNLNKLVELFYKKRVSAVITAINENDAQSLRRNFVIIKKSGFVEKVIEKPRYTKCTIKGCGLYIFDRMLFDAIRITPRTALRNECELTTSIQKLIDHKFPVITCNMVKYEKNLTTEDDLISANLDFLEILRKSNRLRDKRGIIGNNVKMHPQTKIINSCIGNNVIIKNPILIKNSVILDNLTVNKDKDINQEVIF